ncbi:hypothetical protein HID58_069148 [Brassica napus]|uniref:Transmembrane protein n=1 Tax=Brassica napus TaxID=3708 RepID=A0ABQ7ZNI2_BRANA|nr:hypothetical protein HID58_069148 [Brassica napus]
MEEENQKTHRSVSRKDRSHGADEEAAPGDKCSGERCRSSWAAAAIADCVALCCCPCAVVNLLTLAFVKVPWMIGRKCIGRRKKRKKKIEREDRFHHNQRPETVKGVSGGCCGGGYGEWDDHRGEGEARISARDEAERVWLELYQIGHLGFGRVSFTGIHQ